MELIHRLERLRQSRLQAYEADPGDIREHFGIEQTVLAGGYGYRQILELVQNGADAILEASERSSSSPSKNRIEVRLTDRHLYVANTGAPLSTDGLEAILRSHTSPKRGNQIGRFGLGFKSLLALRGRIDILTRTAGAVRFDPARCKQELATKFGISEAPGLRLAWELDLSKEEDDHVIKELHWAETIVRAEINRPEAGERLKSELNVFPSEFLIFFPVPVALDLLDNEGHIKSLSVEFDGALRNLKSGENVSKWRVFESVVSIEDERALGDATHIHGRDEVPLSWAVPVDGRRDEVGRFWAFFPTQTQTRIAGILNAPWKLNSDRNAIIGGAWNDALMDACADLVVRSLPFLATEEDPARPLDSFPRRPERDDEPAVPFVDRVWTAISKMRAIPNSSGRLMRPTELWMHPSDNKELAEAWSDLAKGNLAADHLVHPASLTRSRLARLDALQRRLSERDNAEIEPDATPSLRRYDVQKWFSVIASPEHGIALRVLRLAGKFLDQAKLHDAAVLRGELEIVPAVDGSLIRPKHAVISTNREVSVPGRTLVDPAFAELEGASEIMKGFLGIGEPDQETWIKALSDAAEAARKLVDWSDDKAKTDAAWRRVWADLRSAPPGLAIEFVSHIAQSGDNRRKSIRVKRGDGKWVEWHQTFLPGGIIRAKSDPDEVKRFAVDDFHVAEDYELLERLGVRQRPTELVRLFPGSWNRLDRWLMDADDYYRTHPSVTRSPQYGNLIPKSLNMPAGWSLLPDLAAAARSRLTRALRDLGKEHDLRSVEFGHRTVQTYPTMEFRHPLFWWLLSYGTVHIGGSTVSLAALFARVRLLPEDVRANFQEWIDFEDDFELWSPDVNVNRGHIHDLWRALIAQHSHDIDEGSERLSSLFRLAAADHYVPEALELASGRILLEAAFVTTSYDLAEHAQRSGETAIVLDPDTMQIWLDRGAKDLASEIAPKWSGQTGPLLALKDVFPELLEVLSRQAIRQAACRTVSDLKLSLGDRAEMATCILWDDVLLVDQVELEKRTHSDRTRIVLAEIAPAGWLKVPLDAAIAKIADASVERRRAEVAAKPTLPERLIAAVSNRRRHLLNVLGSIGELSEVQNCDNLKLAELTLAHLGTSTLSSLFEAFAEEGLDPPEKWTPTRAATFVASIGFPPEFVAAGSDKRPPIETISGPMPLPPLHDYQKEVFAGLTKIVDERASKRRAVVSLPTGGGKTRVTVEAAVRLVLTGARENKSVLWIAQTDELCEQAVQAFRQVWLNCGSEGSDLTIIRLWGGAITPSTAPAMPLVVVASIQTMNSRMESEALNWLGQPGLVVVDECHHAITKSYTNLLKWLDADVRGPKEEKSEETPIIGLSATPFRGADEESLRLAKRFENRWLPTDQENLYSKLLAQGVLAKPVYEALESKARGHLKELEKLGALDDDWEGFKAEQIIGRINRLLADDEDRNKLLLNQIENAEEDSILFFANSVKHAEEIAARLNLRGIPAAAVSASTAPSARRSFLEAFQQGKIRVLCNHSVLTTGFDAPKTEMILIARQVFSPVRYMQIVGRGLRGPRNGGTPSCRIVSVLDNLGRFKDRHPFHYCQQYFTTFGG